jgi:NADH-quinone oxidoreductase subunit L
MGKSAQFPLHVWLPDAMEGPTPVSALIHAATMVAAGVYLVGRTYVIFPVEALLVVAYVGAATAIMSATIAVVQTDIKKVLAYSTVSQLGYMMLGLGCYGYYAGLGHLTTHAFFKACLFLGSGSVIHAMHHHQEMGKYGGLWKKLPITFATFMIATLALTGFPYVFSGFHTKDTIIAKAIEFGMMAGGWHAALGWIASGAALLTSFYMFRLIFLTFFGKPRDQQLYDHAHESWVMVIPLIVLAGLSFWYVGGPSTMVGKGPNVVKTMLAMPEQKDAELHAHILEMLAAQEHEGGAAEEAEGHASRWMGLLAPAAIAAEDEAERGDAGGHGLAPTADAHGDETSGQDALEAHYEHIEHAAHVRAVAGSWIVFPLGLIVAALFYLLNVFSADAVAKRFRPVYTFLSNLWYMDVLYRYTIIKPFLLICAFHGNFDKWVVDGIVNGIALVTRLEAWMTGVVDNTIVDGAYNGGAWLTRWSGRAAASAQTGRVRVYLTTILLGAVMLAVIFVFVRG